MLNYNNYINYEIGRYVNNSNYQLQQSMNKYTNSVLNPFVNQYQPLIKKMQKDLDKFKNFEELYLNDKLFFKVKKNNLKLDLKYNDYLKFRENDKKYNNFSEKNKNCNDLDFIKKENNYFFNDPNNIKYHSAVNTKKYEIKYNNDLENNSQREKLKIKYPKKKNDFYNIENKYVEENFSNAKNIEFNRKNNKIE